MNEYSVTYHARTSPFLCEPVEILAPDPRISKILLETSHQNLVLKIQVWFFGEYSEPEMRALGDEMAVWTLDQLSRVTDTHFYDPVCAGHSKTVIHPDGTRHYEDTVSVSLQLGFSIDFGIVDPKIRARRN